jgi:hypothetical protein
MQTLLAMQAARVSLADYFSPRQKEQEPAGATKHVFAGGPSRLAGRPAPVCIPSRIRRGRYLTKAALRRGRYFHETGEWRRCLPSLSCAARPPREAPTSQPYSGGKRDEVAPAPARWRQAEGGRFWQFRLPAPRQISARPHRHRLCERLASPLAMASSSCAAVHRPISTFFLGFGGSKAHWPPRNGNSEPKPRVGFGRWEMSWGNGILGDPWLCCKVGNGNGIQGERYTQTHVCKFWNGYAVQEWEWEYQRDGIGWEMTVSCLPRVSGLHKLISSICLPGYNSCSHIYYPSTRIGIMNQICLNIKAVLKLKFHWPNPNWA